MCLYFTVSKLATDIATLQLQHCSLDDCTATAQKERTQTKAAPLPEDSLSFSNTKACSLTSSTSNLKI
tara:strand:- start:331 stop:534 length:204 start_codon:yes stop_codon:yes gene_type:complete